MTQIIIPSIILLAVVGINYAGMKLAVKNPDLISGFKISEDPEQRKQDIIWLNTLDKYMCRANVLTLIGGIAGIGFRLSLLYYLSLFLPIGVAALLAYVRRRKTTTQRGKMPITIITVMVVVFLSCIPVFYSCCSNLKVSFVGDNIEISGLYGRNIPIYQINEAALCQSLPPISIRTNGFALGKTCLGHFRTTEGKDIILFTHSDKCFIRITLTDGTTYYLSSEDREETDLLLLQIQDKLRKQPPVKE